MGLFSRSVVTMKYEMMALGVPEKISEILAAASKVDASELSVDCPRPKGDTRTNYRWVEEGIRYLKRTEMPEMRMNLVESMCWAVFDHGADEIFRREYAAQNMPLVGAGISAVDLQVATSRSILGRQGQRYWDSPEGEPDAVTCLALRPGKDPIGGMLVVDRQNVGFFDIPSLTSDDMDTAGRYQWFSSIDMVDALELVADQALKLGGLAETDVRPASRDTTLTVVFYDRDLDRGTTSFAVPREDFYSSTGIFNRSAFSEVVRNLDRGIAQWKEKETL